MDRFTAVSAVRTCAGSGVKLISTVAIVIVSAKWGYFSDFLAAIASSTLS